MSTAILGLFVCVCKYCVIWKGDALAGSCTQPCCSSQLTLTFLNQISSGAFCQWEMKRPPHCSFLPVHSYSSRYNVILEIYHHYLLFFSLPPPPLPSTCTQLKPVLKNQKSRLLVTIKLTRPRSPLYPPQRNQLS